MLYHARAQSSLLDYIETILTPQFSGAYAV